MAIPTLHDDGSVDTQVLFVTKNSAGAKPTTEEIYDEVADFIDVGTVHVRDARTADQEFSIEKNGFQFERMTTPEGIDYLDATSVAQKLYPILEQFIAQRLGASSAKVYNHVVRHKARDEYGEGEFEKDNYKGPARTPHCDMSDEYAKLASMGLLPDVHKAAVEERKRGWLINVWKPLKTIQRDPLIVLENSSASPEDFLVVNDKRRGPLHGSYFLQKRDGQRWWYMKEQTPEDLLLFLQYDSEGTRPVPHVSVALPTPPPEPRQSIELRIAVTF